MRGGNVWTSFRCWLEGARVKKGSGGVCQRGGGGCKYIRKEQSESSVPFQLGAAVEKEESKISPEHSRREVEGKKCST